MGIDALTGYGSLQYRNLNKKLGTAENSFAEKLNEQTSEVPAAEQKEDISLLNRYELMARVRNHIEMMEEKLENNDVEQKFQIGGMTFSEKEWDELLENFDEQEDALKEAVEEEIAKNKEQKEYSEEQIDTIVAKWLEDKEEEDV